MAIELEKYQRELKERIDKRAKAKKVVVSSTAEHGPVGLSMTALDRAYEQSREYIASGGGVASDFQIIQDGSGKITPAIHAALDRFEMLGLLNKISPVDGMPGHMVIELANSGGWLYYDPDNGLKTLTARQAKHHLAPQDERLMEENVWS